MRTRRRLVLASVMGTLVSIVGEARPAKAERAPYQLELGPIAGVVARGTKQNPDSIGYGPAFLYGLQLRIRVAPWLRASARYQVAYHDIEIPPKSLGTGASNIVSDAARTNSVSAYFHPTWSPLERLHVMGVFGVGWTKIDVPPLKLDPPNGASVRSRGGVLVETPVGVSLSFDILRGWMSAGFDSTYSPAFLQTGGMYESDPYVNRSGYPASAAAMPRVSYTVTNLVWVAINL